MANGRNNKKRKASQNRAKQQQPKEPPREVITLEFEDGVEQECFVEGVFDCAGQDYIALVPDNDSGDVYIYKYIEEKDEDYHLEDEADEAKFAAAVQEYENLVGHTQGGTDHE